MPQAAAKSNWERIPGKTDCWTNLNCQLCTLSVALIFHPKLQMTPHHTCLCCPLQKYSPALYSSTSEHWPIKQGLSIILYTWKFITIRGSRLFVVFSSRESHHKIYTKIFTPDHYQTGEFPKQDGREGMSGKVRSLFLHGISVFSVWLISPNLSKSTETLSRIICMFMHSTQCDRPIKSRKGQDH